jgi:hypothetical protein
LDLFENLAIAKKIIRPANSYEITTSREFDISRFDKKTSNIKLVNYISSDFSIDFVEQCKNLGIKINLLCDDKSKLPDLRVKFFDYQVLDFDRSQTIELIKKEAPNLSVDFSIISGKKVVSKGVVSSSYRDVFGVDSDKFLLDLEWCMLYS